MKKTEQNPIEHKLKDDDTVYFLHIPKTAGTTLTTLLDSHFDLDSITKAQVWQKLLQNGPHDFSKYRLIRGHFGYGLHRVLPKKPIYITMLREPIERTISFYHHMCTDPLTNNWVKDFLSKSDKLSDLIYDTDKKLVFANEQTRHIALDLDVLSITKHLDKDKLNNFFYESISEFISPDITDDKLLSMAKQHLLEFTFFGLTERFDDSLFLLCYTFGWRPIHNVQKEMVLPGRPLREEFSKDVIDKIVECTKLDAELYAYARSLFEDRFSYMVQDLKEKYYDQSLADMPFQQMIYELLERHYNNRFAESKDPVHSIEYDFSKSMYGSGWYAREVLSDGNIFRWTGPDTVSTIDFPLAMNEDYKIQFCVVMCLSQDIVESLRLKVNKINIDLSLQQNEGKIIFEGVIPKSSLNGEKNFIRFSFEVNHTVSPHSINPDSADKRMLGVALDLINVSNITSIL